jgi:hypothetical protein
MLAGRPHEAVGNGSPRWMIAAPPQAGAQNPAYRPAHPPSKGPDLQCSEARGAAGHIGGTCASAEGFVQGVAGTAAGLRYEVAIKGRLSS